jgi:MSHA biogenesis protein MshK
MRWLLLTALGLLMLAGIARAGDLRDPMRPAGAPAAARPVVASSLKLEGVIAGARRVAIINGRLVRAGDTIAGARILEVLAHSVRYERAGRIQTLTLPVAQANTGVRVVRSVEAKAE